MQQNNVKLSINKIHKISNQPQNKSSWHSSFTSCFVDLHLYFISSFKWRAFSVEKFLVHCLFSGFTRLSDVFYITISEDTTDYSIIPVQGSKTSEESYARINKTALLLVQPQFLELGNVGQKVAKSQYLYSHSSN